MTKLNRVILALGVGALVVAGCGKEESAPPTTAGSPATEPKAFENRRVFHWKTDWRKRPLHDLFPDDTFVFLEADTKVLDSGLRGLDSARMLRDPKLREALRPMLEMVGANVEDPVSALLDNVPITSWIDGKIAIGLRGFTVGIRGPDGNVRKTFLGPKSPLDSDFAHIVLASAADGLDWRDLSVLTPELLIVFEPGVITRDMAPIFWESPPVPVERSEVEIEGIKVKHGRIAVPYTALTLDIFAILEGDRWIVATSRDLMARVLSKAQSGSLGRRDAFVRARERFTAGEPALFAYVDVAAALAIAHDLVPPLVARSAEKLGVSSVQGVGVGVSFVEGGIRETLGVTFKGKPGGVFRLLDAMPPGIGTLEVAPVEARLVMGGKFDAQMLLTRLKEFLADVLPGYELPDGFEEIKAQTGIDFKQDVLPSLGDEMTLLVYPPRGFLPIPDATVVLGLRDEEKFKRLFAKLRPMLQAMGVQFKEQEIEDGKPAWMVFIPSYPGLPPTVAVRDQKLLIATASDILIRVLPPNQGEEPGTKLKDGEVFQQVMRGLADGDRQSLIALIYVDIRNTMPPIMRRLQSLPGTGQLFQMLGRFVDMNKLDLNLAASYFSGVAVGVRRDDTAVSIETFSPAMLLLPLMLANAGSEPQPIIIEIPEAPDGSNEPFVGFNTAQDGEGLVVGSVIEGTPAEKVGLRAGDRILAVNGAAVDGYPAFKDVIVNYKPGESVTLTVERKGEKIAVVLTLGRRGDFLR